MVLSRFVAGVLAATLTGTMSSPIWAQDYPNKIIRIITATAGGGSDFISRLVAQGMSHTIGQTVIVDNRGSGVFPGEFLSKSAPDGYTVLINGGNTWLVQLFQKSPYDPVRDFAPISWLSRNVNIIVVHPSIPVSPRSVS